ncbi:glycosyltransferase family 39 protein [Candidatus Daviesbacteria bacterium]|nr:glycosyltransferase family 39 protein [Candidatus Daviesbacteria bacterium]
MRGNSYFLIPIFLIVVQGIYSISSIGELRLEEAIESIRSVYWFQNHLVWNGGYTNLGWYTVLAVVYNLFGFSVYSAKFVKLFVYILALLCLAALLKKYLGEKLAIVPLLMIGFSPTLIYLNSLQISHGIEVSYFLICAYLISNLNFKKRAEWMLQTILGIVAAIAVLSYPAFIYYLPIISFYYLYQLKNQCKKASISLIVFCTYLLLSILYIKNRQILIYDTNSNLGLFRGGGRLEFDLDLLISNFRIMFSDLFQIPVSYYFEPLKTEFSDFYPMFVVIFVMVISLALFLKIQRLRFFIGFVWTCFLGYSIVLNLFGPIGLGGIRRETIILTLFYLLFVIVWKFISNIKKSSFGRNLVLVVLGLLLIHHIFVYPQNLGQLNKQSKFGNWFAPNAELSFRSQIKTIEAEDLWVNCEENVNPYAHSRCAGLSINYALIAGECLWNRRLCHKVIAFDAKNQKHFLINLNFWGEGSHAEP